MSNDMLNTQTCVTDEIEAFIVNQWYLIIIFRNHLYSYAHIA